MDRRVANGAGSAASRHARQLQGVGGGFSELGAWQASAETEFAKVRAVGPWRAVGDRRQRSQRPGGTIHFNVGVASPRRILSFFGISEEREPAHDQIFHPTTERIGRGALPGASPASVTQRDGIFEVLQKAGVMNSTWPAAASAAQSQGARRHQLSASHSGTVEVKVGRAFGSSAWK